ncbi:MAG TPA: haloacid dehalogenase-like hydrolase [Gemmatimonadaceae bacterium]|nr:haloacid dehalogenase-like hydrolase [Gemmatimonadaceae bacterium]
MKLVLFDIDGTILWSDGAGRRAMTAALTHVFGSAGPTGYRYDGKTDPQIVRDLMRLEGHGEEAIDERMAPLIERYLQGLETELAEGLHTHLFDGIPELLDALEARDDMVLGLLTGNLRAGAALKLRSAGIDMSRFRIGAFGSDHHHRPELPAIAQRRAREELGLEIPGAAMVVIGDTPADIECGRAIGARAVGVATGRYTVAELASHSPMAVFPNLADTAAVMRAIVDA